MAREVLFLKDRQADEGKGGLSGTKEKIPDKRTCCQESFGFELEREECNWGGEDRGKTQRGNLKRGG